MQLTDAVVLVTGASAGIGHAAAARFAAKRAKVLVHGRDPDRTRDVAREVGGRALIADLNSPADRQRLATEALDAFGRRDVLVNNAGFGYFGRVSAMSVDVIRRLIEVDLLASIELTRDLLPGMVEQKRGAICFVTSIAGRTGVAGEAVYSASLHAHAAATDTCRHGGRRRGPSGGARPRRRVETTVAADRPDRARAGSRHVPAACGPLRWSG